MNDVWSMMCKAKREDNGEWIYGFYWTNLLGNHFIRRVQDENANFILEDVEIEFETVSRCTGFKDKHGVDIYENDLILYDFEEGQGIVQWDDEFAMFVILIGGWYLDFALIENTLEVIGNKFDKEK